MNNRTVRIFLSSTFRDFGEERDLLVKRVFPALREKLKNRFVELVDVDLRWGITIEEAERGEILPICLSEIDRAQPYFICMLGDRYGWIPSSEGYANDLLERQPWLKQHLGGTSVTELEILHGVLNKPRMHSRALFYFRSSAYARAKGGDYLPAPEERTRQTILKQSIRERGFETTPYAKPEALARRIERDLWRILDSEFPATSVPDPFERDLMRHEAYAASKRGLYIGGEQYIAALDIALNDSYSRILITGDSGGGKSALLSNFFEAYKKSHRRHFVHEHYLGASSDAAEPHLLVRRLIEFIHRATSSKEEIPSDSQKLMDSLPLWLIRASEFSTKHKTRFIFVLDSLNSLTDQQNLRWFPSFVSEGISFVVSCLPGTVQDALISNAGSLLSQSKLSKWNEITVLPLTTANGVNLLNTYLARFNKKLPAQMIQKIKEHYLAVNPLFIQTIAEELRLFGRHEELEKHLNYLLTSLTIDDLFERVLKRVENDCGKKLVKAAMTAIWGSRSGLTESEILSIAKLTPVSWASIRYALDAALLETAGKITFSHDYMRLAVKNRYLHTDGLQKSAHQVLAQWFTNQPPSARRAQEEPWQLHKLGERRKLRQILLNPSIFLELWKFNTYELLSYWRDHWDRDCLLLAYEKKHPEWSKWRSQHRENARVWPELIAALADALWEAGYFNNFGAYMQMYARDLMSKSLGARTVSVAKRDIHCAYYLRHMADSASLAYAKRAIKVLEVLEQSQDLASAYTVMSLCLSSNGENFEAEKYYHLATNLLEKISESTNKILLKHEVVVGHFFTSNYVRMGECEVISNLVAEEEQVLGREHRLTLQTLDLLVGCLQSEERWAESAELALSLYQRCFRTFGEDHVQTGYAAGKFGKAKMHLNDLESSEWGLSKATEILAKAFPERHQNRSIFLEALAETYERMELPHKAKPIRERLKSELIGQFLYWKKDELT